MTRMLAVFESRDALLAAIASAKRQHLAIVTALVPTHDDEVLAAVGVPVSWAGRIACVGAIIGGLAGLLFPAWTVEQWPHVTVSGKPLLSWPTFLIISFETALLCAALAGIAAFLIGTWRSRRMAGPEGTALLHAARSLISDASSALLIACPSDRAHEAAASFEAHGAIKCHVL
jgi:hypothetical protein